MIRLPDGTKLDVPAPVRCWQRYDTDERALQAASFRLGYRQRQRLGEYYYVHELIPDRAFSTRKEAIDAVLCVLGRRAAPAERGEG